ncbi:MAG TPA: hypothetical protein VFV95_15425 [Vicinamibacterales bacterium]|nr:hypothetical protein [Vicinamibacterales bacterium]
MLDWIESTRLAIWMQESPSLLAFPTILTLHTTGMALLVGASWILDMRLLGINRNVPLSYYRWVFPVVGFGLIVNVTTGVMLFFKNAATWGTSIPFFIKMCLVVASAATIVPMRSYVVHGDRDQTVAVGKIRLLAIASILTWSGAVTAGRLLAYIM